MKRSETIRKMIIKEIEESGKPTKKGRRVAVRISSLFLSRSSNHDDIDFFDLVIFVRKDYLTKLVDSKDFRDTIFPRAKESIVENYYGIGFKEYVPFMPDCMSTITCVIYGHALEDGEIYGYMFKNLDEKVTWR